LTESVEIEFLWVYRSFLQLKSPPLKHYYATKNTVPGQENYHQILDFHFYRLYLIRMRAVKIRRDIFFQKYPGIITIPDNEKNR